MSRPVRVVLAEDGDLLRAGLVALLNDTPGVELAGVAASYDELLAEVDRSRPDVVLTDIRMPPDFTDEGIRAANALRGSHPAVGVVVLTQYADVDYALDLVRDGSARRGYLLKERVGDTTELVRALGEVAAGGSVIDETVVSSLMSAGRRSSGSRLDRLTPRELEVLGHVAQGRSNQAIADTLVITDRAVEKHIGSILAKLDIAHDAGVHRRVAAALLFLSEAGVGRSRLPETR